MTPYKNIDGDSGVVAYETKPTAIAIRFRDGKTYLYTYDTPGANAVETMKKLAALGQGLATYINQHVRENYARRVA